MQVMYIAAALIRGVDARSTSKQRASIVQKYACWAEAPVPHHLSHHGGITAISIFWSSSSHLRKNYLEQTTSSRCLPTPGDVLALARSSITLRDLCLLLLLFPTPSDLPRLTLPTLTYGNTATCIFGICSLYGI